MTRVAQAARPRLPWFPLLALFGLACGEAEPPPAVPDTDIVVLRSTWDFHRQLADYIGWLPINHGHRFGAGRKWQPYGDASSGGGIRGILNVMRHIGMLPPGKGRKPIVPVVAKSTSWVRAPASGIVSRVVDLGARVDDGQELATVGDPLGDGTTTGRRCGQSGSSAPSRMRARAVSWRWRRTPSSSTGC